jgi:hypothetical protein
MPGLQACEELFPDKSGQLLGFPDNMTKKNGVASTDNSVISICSQVNVLFALSAFSC